MANLSLLLAQRSCVHSQTIRHFSAAPESSTASGHSRVARTLYRQLLRWCAGTDPAIPLSSFIPPIHISAPEQIDLFRTELLAHRPSGSGSEMDDAIVRRARQLLPHKTLLKRNNMTVPIHTSSDLRKFFQAIFRLNFDQAASAEHQKQRVAVAFGALKSLNELTERIQSLLESRSRHEDREHVQFRIGQVVQHREERWRGVVVAWEKVEGTKSLTANKTSLTTKDYGEQSIEPHENNINDDVQIQIDVIIDEGDAHLMGYSSEWTSAMQSDLVLVEDKNLLRIRSRSLSDFVRFDRERSVFIPNDLQRFTYPLDVDSTTTPQSLKHEELKLCMDIIEATQQLALKLQSYIFDETSCPKDQGLSLLSNVQERLSNLIIGDVLPMSFQFAPSDPSVSTLAAHHLHVLLNISLEVMDVMFHRARSKECKHRLKFSLGDIVRHKVFGFRGVIVAWDPRPTVDVSRWDGLQHIENPMEQPFYHIIPDQKDCIDAFGAERPVRYVCEENLEVCPDNLRLINVDLEHEWTRSASGDRYIPSDVVRFKYADDFENDEVTERCMTKIQDEINLWQYEGRQLSSQGPLSICSLLRLVNIVDNLQEAIVVQEMIKEMRKAHPNLDLRRSLETGLSELMRGNGEEALDIYRTVVEQDHDSYPEAYNKIATCEFMMSRIQESLDHTKMALELDPLHVQALNGLGLIHFENGDFQKAADCFKESIAIDPWSPVTAKLSVSIDIANQQANQTTQRNEVPR